MQYYSQTVELDCATSAVVAVVLILLGGRKKQRVFIFTFGWFSTPPSPDDGKARGAEKIVVDQDRF